MTKISAKWDLEFSSRCMHIFVLPDPRRPQQTTNLSLSEMRIYTYIKNNNIRPASRRNSPAQQEEKEEAVEAVEFHDES
jgi:hypothetical protein